MRHVEQQLDLRFGLVQVLYLIDPRSESCRIGWVRLFVVFVTKCSNLSQVESVTQVAAACTTLRYRRRAINLRFIVLLDLTRFARILIDALGAM